MLTRVLSLTLIIINTSKFAYQLPALVMTQADKTCNIVHTSMVASAIVNAAFVVGAACFLVLVQFITGQTGTLESAIGVDTRVFTVVCV